MVMWSERDVYIRPTHPSPGLNALSQADFPLKLLALCLQGDGHATSKDHIGLPHLLIVIKGICLMMFASTGILWRRCCWRRQLLPIQKSLTLF
jgi:hypothetical protein